ncbi:FadR family transcriptional regulator [Ectopseudomonas composti]|jgi:GntR family transcriptional repressor for pyruvate dehydrogenase complex|uniref:GntR family transcriptional regulator n=1 Tax=Ectopseudomonas composti TaxID=658457 RepID=A0A1I5MC03_9GAMM|nr:MULTISPECIES: FadR/GntR family transcriptional regulator [Pseudomonas]EZH83427.1 GntR family transcriptional regulator [Pseudomonas composti]MDN5515889.1 FadR family transcriptional regulator [Pseudomonas sp.]QNH06796.1 FadR family transcriptional regulator [Pseudomonas sp. B11D7D]SFP07082.1 GntR family transcriptional regulator, transcriptional repressor for pyruvate dehydrogenase complex [Pseudomonas composti]
MFSSSKLVDAVVRKLLAPIEQGLWPVGQMLPGQRELAEQMEVSRPSLREAITILETLGVVRSLPGKGVMVLERQGTALPEVQAPPSATMADVLQLRYALEPFIVGLVAQSLDGSELSQLRLLLLDMREAVEDGDMRALASAYTSFHRKLVALSSNPMFLSIARQIGSALEQSDQLVRRNSDYAEDILQEHEAILRAIRRQDSEQASQAMRQHILNEGTRLNINLRVPLA